MCIGLHSTVDPLQICNVSDTTNHMLLCVIVSTAANKIPRTDPYHIYPYHTIPAIIAVNMILAAASGAFTAICIAVWAQVRM